VKRLEAIAACVGVAVLYARFADVEGRARESKAAEGLGSVSVHHVSRLIRYHDN